MGRFPGASRPALTPVLIRLVRPGDGGLVAAASHLLDGPARPETGQVVEVWTF
jgi:hypothetical protein